MWRRTVSRGRLKVGVDSTAKSEVLFNSHGGGADMRKLFWIMALAGFVLSSSVGAEPWSDDNLKQLADLIGAMQQFPGGADAIDEMSEQLIHCSVVTLAAATCLKNTPGNDDIERTRDSSDWTGKLGFVIGRKIGVSEKALEARFRLSLDDIKHNVNSCREMSILTLDFSNSCQALVSDPVGHFKQLLLDKQERLKGRK
jgi:hypothetical protein